MKSHYLSPAGGRRVEQVRRTTSVHWRVRGGGANFQPLSLTHGKESRVGEATDCVRAVKCLWGEFVVFSDFNEVANSHWLSVVHKICPFCPEEAKGLPFTMKVWG